MNEQILELKIYLLNSYIITGLSIVSIFHILCGILNILTGINCIPSGIDVIPVRIQIIPYGIDVIPYLCKDILCCISLLQGRIHAFNHECKKFQWDSACRRTKTTFMFVKNASRQPKRVVSCIDG